MKYSYLVITLPLLCVLPWNVCNDDPASVGLGLLPTGDSVNVSTITVTGTSDNSFLYRVNGRSTIFLTGMSNGIEARTLLNFTGLATIPVNVTIDSAILSMTIAYRFRDSTGALGFELRRVAKAITPSTFLWDSSNAAGAYSDTVSGRYIKNISPQDSAIKVPLDTLLIRQWMGTNSGTVIFIPGGTIIAGFANTATLTADLRPLLTVSYHDSMGTTGTYSGRPAWGLFVADGTIPLPADRITLQAGISTLGIVRFDSIPIPATASISTSDMVIRIRSA